MALSYGLTNPAACLINTITPEPTPIGYKMYIHNNTNYYYSTNGGSTWARDSTISSSFGNFAYNETTNLLGAMSIKSRSSTNRYSYYTYPSLSRVTSWQRGVLASSSSRTYPNRNTSYHKGLDRYLGINTSDSPYPLVYNSSPFTNSTWTAYTFGISNSSYRVCFDYNANVYAINSDDEKTAVIIYYYSSTNVIHTYEVDLSNNTKIKEITKFSGMSTSTRPRVEFLPGIGYLFGYNKNNVFTYMIYNPVTNTVSSEMTVNGLYNNSFYSSFWYCPWTKEMFLYLSSSITDHKGAYISYTKDGINWTSKKVSDSNVDGYTRFLTDGTNIIVPQQSTSSYFYSSDKGNTWTSKTNSNSLFDYQSLNPSQSIVIPFYE